MTDTRLATKRQLWALFCITKQDYRKMNLTYDEASDMIKKLGNPEYKKVSKKVEKYNDAQRIMEEAVQAGLDALNKCTPTPMVVQQHTNVMNDNSPVEKSWFVESGVCGFAWIQFKSTTTPNRKFLAGLKKAGLAGEHKDWSKSYQGGFSYWVSQGGQSMERKMAFAHAFADVLDKNGITCYTGSRMD